MTRMPSATSEGRMIFLPEAIILSNMVRGVDLFLTYLIGFANAFRRKRIYCTAPLNGFANENFKKANCNCTR